MRYDSLLTLAVKYTHAQTVLTVTERVERARSIVIIKHKCMRMYHGRPQGGGGGKCRPSRTPTGK